MKNITVSLDNDIHRRVRLKAAEGDTSVSAMVRRFLIEVASLEIDVERLKREEARPRDAIGPFRAANRLSREDLHARGR